jgi:hypothetical protein
MTFTLYYNLLTLAHSSFYFQRELAPGEGLDVDAGDALKEVVTTALTWSDIAAATGREGPDVIT